MLRLLSILLFAVVLAACVAEDIPNYGPAPVSPLIPNEVPVLLENQWRLTEIIHDGTSHDFDSIAPVLATFQPGQIDLWACNGFSIFFDTTNIGDPNEYRLRNGDGTARDCADGGTEQENDLSRALYATNRYEIEGDTLILSGENAQVTFVIDNEATKPDDWM